MHPKMDYSVERYLFADKGNTRYKGLLVGVTQRYGDKFIILMRSVDGVLSFVNTSGLDRLREYSKGVVSDVLPDSLHLGWNLQYYDKIKLFCLKHELMSSLSIQIYEGDEFIFEDSIISDWDKDSQSREELIHEVVSKVDDRAFNYFKLQSGLNKYTIVLNLTTSVDKFNTLLLSDDLKDIDSVVRSESFKGLRTAVSKLNIGDTVSFKLLDSDKVVRGTVHSLKHGFDGTKISVHELQKDGDLVLNTYNYEDLYELLRYDFMNNMYHAEGWSWDYKMEYGEVTP